MIGETTSRAKAKAAVAVALALASLLPTPAPTPVNNKPVDGEVRDGWTWKEDNNNPKGGYWWRFRVMEGQAQAIPFTEMGRITRPTTALPVTVPNTLYLGQAPGRARTPIHALPAGQAGTTNCRT